MNFNYFLKEGIIMGKNTMEHMAMMETAIGNIKKYKLWNSPIVYRGFNMKPSSAIIHKITNERTGFRGKLSEKVEKVIDLLKLPTAPVFVTREAHNAKFFGPVRIFIPDSNFISYINPEVQDLVFLQDSGPSAEELVAGYVKYPNSIPTTKEYQEVIIVCKSYFLIYPPQMIGLSGKSRLSTIKKPEDIVKYNDVVKLYNEYMSYLRWFERERVKENPKLKDYYIMKGSPKKWFD